MATLVDVREQFVRTSGRFDLVSSTSTWADNGADWYIKAGQRLLEGLAGHPLQRARRIVRVSAGTVTLALSGLRSVLEVWAGDSEASKQLKWYAPPEFRQRWPEPWEDLAQGTPVAWTMGRHRSYPDQATVDKFNNYGADLISSPTAYEQRSIVFLPAPDTATQIEVYGLFETPVLSSDTDTNYWTLEHEDLLVLAALYKLETMLGNAERQRDWLLEIKERLMMIEKDWIETEAAQAWEMRG